MGIDEREARLTEPIPSSSGNLGLSGGLDASGRKGVYPIPEHPFALFSLSAYSLALYSGSHSALIVLQPERYNDISVLFVYAQAVMRLS